MRYVVIAEDKETHEKFIMGAESAMSLWTLGDLSKLKKIYSISIANTYEDARKYLGYIIARSSTNPYNGESKPCKYIFRIHKVDSLNFPYLIDKPYYCRYEHFNLHERSDLSKVAKYGNFDLDWLKKNDILNLTYCSRIRLKG